MNWNSIKDSLPLYDKYVICYYECPDKDDKNHKMIGKNSFFYHIFLNKKSSDQNMEDCTGWYIGKYIKGDDDFFKDLCEFRLDKRERIRAGIVARDHWRMDGLSCEKATTITSWAYLEIPQKGK